MNRYLLLAGLLMSLATHAQLPNVSIDHITDRDGLPSRSVDCAVADSSGFMWFGTRQGLARYDGYTFQPVVTGSIHGLAADKTGAVYASTISDRLVRVAGPQLTGQTLVGPVEGGGYHTFVDSFGQVWFSDVEAVYRYDPATAKTHRYPMTKTTYIFHKGSFVEDSQRNVWVVGMEVGLFKFDRRTNQLRCKMGLDCPTSSHEKELIFYRGFMDQADVLWVALTGRGLLRYDTRTDQSTFYVLPNHSISAVCDGADEQGRRLLWIGTEKGLAVFRPDIKQFAAFTELMPQPYSVQDIVRSPRTGIVWVCTSEGILKYDPHNQFIKTNRSPASQQPVTAILVDRTDPTGQTVWLAFSRLGLCRWNRATGQTRLFPFPQYASELEINWLGQDRNNTLWLGCNQWHQTRPGTSSPADNQFEGVFRFDPRAGRLLPPPFTTHHRFFSVPFYSLGLFDQRGRFWIGNHYESLHVIDPATGQEQQLWPKAAHDQLFANGNWVMDVLEDSRGRVWLATYQGIFWFDEAARLFRKTKAEGAFLDLAKAPDGMLWAVAWNYLVKLDPTGAVRRVWSQKDGLYDIECRRVVVDRQNRVWIGSFDGLLRFEEPTNSFRRFTVNDGLLTNNTMFDLALTPFNDLLAGNVGGWNTLNLSQLNRSGAAQQQVSRVRLTSARINNRPFATNWSEPVVLGPEQTAVSFDFSALNYRKPTDNDYEYYLSGLEKTWADAGHAHSAVYTNLSPGPYVFMARLRGQPAGALRLAFQIRPFFYDTTWFRLLAGGLLVGLVLFIYRNRRSVETMKTELRIKEAIRQQKEAEYNEEVAAYQLKISETEMTALRSQMNPHFIFNCLNSIKLYATENDSEKASDYLSKFSRLIRLVLENSRHERVTLQNELDTLELYLEMEAMRFKQKLQFRINLQPDIDAQFLELPPLLIQPYVENAIWHGLMHRPEGGTVTVMVNQPQDDQITITITDDGVGRVRAAELKS